MHNRMQREEELDCHETAIICNDSKGAVKKSSFFPNKVVANDGAVKNNITAIRSITDYFDKFVSMQSEMLNRFSLHGKIKNSIYGHLEFQNQ